MNLNIDILQVAQVTTGYVNWFSNNEVTRFSDNQYREFSFHGQCSYVEACLNDEKLDLYGIFDENFHIGNILISGLASAHRRLELNYVIGETEYWGKGVASFAIAQMIEIGKNKYGPHKFCAGVASGNIGSLKVLEKNGFVLEGIRKEHLFYSGKFFDQLDYGLLVGSEKNRAKK